MLIRLGNYIVLCEVHDSGGNAHASNYRALLRSAIKAAGEDVAPHLGFKQKYTLQQGRDQCHVCESVSRKPSNIYCGVGCENFLVRDIAEVHAQACLTAGIHLSSMNSQECAGQWEFEIDRRSDEQASDCSALTIADDVWVARYLLVRIGERSDIEVAFDTTPLTAKFSTEFTRDPRCGRTAINALVNILQSASLQQGLAISAPLAKKNGHERPDLSNFSSSTEQSIYIPMQTEAKGCGHIEYCRSVLYTDPYQIGIHLIRGLLEPGTESCNLYDNENVSINS